MSSTIKLYEHNQKTYDALLDIVGERDRACIINKGQIVEEGSKDVILESEIARQVYLGEQFRM